MPTFAPHTLNVTITSAGTRQQVTTTSPTGARLMFIQANSGNGGNLFIGGSTVSSTVYGVKLAAGASISIGNDGYDAKLDLSQIYADTSNSGDGFSVLYF